MEFVRLLRRSKTSTLEDCVWVAEPMLLLEVLAAVRLSSTLKDGFELELKLVGDVDPEWADGPAGGNWLEADFNRFFDASDELREFASLVDAPPDRLDVDFLRKSLFLSLSRLLESSERILLRLDGWDCSFLGVIFVTTAISFWSLISRFDLFGVSRFRLRLELLLEAWPPESFGVFELFRTVNLSNTVERNFGWDELSLELGIGEVLSPLLDALSYDFWVADVDVLDVVEADLLRGGRLSL